MICPHCKMEGKKSTVMSLGARTTLVNYTPYWDEEGNYHNHDGNTTTHEYKCSEGHFWIETDTGSCWCGWKGAK